MVQIGIHRSCGNDLPGWVSEDVRLYLDHIECGKTIRALAREVGVHASTILRKVRKTESRRDDPLIDEALSSLGRLRRGQRGMHVNREEVLPDMSVTPLDEETLKRDATRILRALMQPGSVLAVVPDVETAVVVRESADGRPRQVAKVASLIAQAMALQGWIACRPQGRVSRYYITPGGRSALNRFLAQNETREAGFREAATVFRPAGKPTSGAKLRPVSSGQSPRRAVGAEAPLRVLARRRDKNGQTYLSSELVEIGERMRMDFELATMESKIGPNWQSIMQASDSTRMPAGQGPDLRPMEARARLEKALRYLGPELGDIVLITCCHQQGMEYTEKKLAMPARSGKFVLRIALNLLARHYSMEGGESRDMIF